MNSKGNPKSNIQELILRIQVSLENVKSLDFLN